MIRVSECSVIYKNKIQIIFKSKYDGIDVPLRVGYNLRKDNVGTILSKETLYTAGHLHIAVPHCSHSRAPIVHTAVPQENNEHGCVCLRCRAVCKLPGCVEGHPWYRENLT